MPGSVLPADSMLTPEQQAAVVLYALLLLLCFSWVAIDEFQRWRNKEKPPGPPAEDPEG